MNSFNVCFIITSSESDISRWSLSTIRPRLRLTCSNSVMANFWCGMQCLAVQMSSLVSSAMWKWILIKMFSCRIHTEQKRPSTVSLVDNRTCQQQRRHSDLTKHSAASSMMPSWNRCSSWKVLASALRRASEGKTFSLLYWNWANILCRTRGEADTWSVLGGRKLVRDQLVDNRWEPFSPSERRKCTSPPCTCEWSADENYAWRCRGARGPERQEWYQKCAHMPRPGQNSRGNIRN